MNKAKALGGAVGELLKQIVIFLLIVLACTAVDYLFGSALWVVAFVIVLLAVLKYFELRRKTEG